MENNTQVAVCYQQAKHLTT